MSSPPGAWPRVMRSDRQRGQRIEAPAQAGDAPVEAVSGGGLEASPLHGARGYGGAPRGGVRRSSSDVSPVSSPRTMSSSWCSSTAGKAPTVGALQCWDECRMKSPSHSRSPPAALPAGSTQGYSYV